MSAGTLRRLALALALALCAATSNAGTTCVEANHDADALRRAAQLAVSVRVELEAADAPVALVSRVGTDLSEHGLRYSHAGFAVRDHRDGAWTVVHLLNECGTDRSALFAEGLMNFYLDDLARDDTRITWIEPETAAALARLMADERALMRLHRPRYNLLSPPGSQRSQNSTSWVLEVLDAATPRHASRSPMRGTPAGAGERFRPSTIRIAYGKRIVGGLFASNIDFSEHPVATRLSGRYPVVTVASILDDLEGRGLVLATREWRDGAWRATPGRP